MDTYRIQESKDAGIYIDSDIHPYISYEIQTIIYVCRLLDKCRMTTKSALATSHAYTPISKRPIAGIRRITIAQVKRPTLKPKRARAREGAKARERASYQGSFSLRVKSPRNRFCARSGPPRSSASFEAALRLANSSKY